MNNLEILLSCLAKPGVFAPEKDLAFYRSVQPDLASFNEDQLLEHFETYGRREGRIVSPACHRLGFLAQIPLDKDILEIGPAYKPVLKGPHVKYFDILSREDLIKKAQSEGYSVDSCPEIDFVSGNADLRVVDRQFQNAFSSHCLEHQPDLVTHLQKISDIIAPNGFYFLIIPDKRFCFDATIDESKLEEVLSAYRERRTVHTIKSIFDHIVKTTHNDPLLHWNGVSADPREKEQASRIDFANKKIANAQGQYIDVHAWQFTPQSFRHIISELHRLGLIPFTIERVYSTVFGSNEFCSILKQTGGDTPYR